MKNDFLSFPFNIPSSIFKQIVAQTPGIYQVSNVWNWGGPSDRDKVISPTRIALDMNGEGLFTEDFITLDMSDPTSWDTGLGVDYTINTNRGGKWFYVTAYSDEGVVKMLLSDVADTLDTAVSNFRTLEKFYCYDSDALNHQGQLVGGVIEGDVDITSFTSLSGQSVQILSGTDLPNVAIPEVFFFNTVTRNLYFSMGGDWVVISQSAQINDFDFAIGSTFSFMGDSAPTGYLPLTGINQILLIVDYQKLYDNIGIKYGGDGITTFALPTIAQASGDEFVKDWSVIGSAWAGGSTINIPHSLATKFSDLEKRFIIRDPSAPDKEYNAEYTLFSSSSSKTFGQRLNSSGDINSINIQIGEDSSKYMSDTGLETSVPTTWEYKIVLTKDSPLPADVTLCMYVGNGSLSVANDAGIDSRVTALENQPIYADAPYDTGWVVNAFALGSTTVINHGLNAKFSDLITTFVVRDPLVPDVEYEANFASQYSAGATSGIGQMLAPNSVDVLTTCVIQVGNQNSRYMLDTGALLQIPATWEYRVILRKTEAVSFINVQNAFINHKDWVPIWEETPTPSIVKVLADGKYTIYVEGFDGTRDIFCILQVDRTTGNDIVLSSGFTNGGSFVQARYTISTNTLDLWDLGSFVSGNIYRVEKWQDTTGADKNSVKLADGYENVWQNLLNTGTFDLKVEDGEYRLRGKSSGSDFYSIGITVDTSNGGAVFFGAATASISASYTASTGTWFISGLNVIGIDKATDRLTLDINHTREHVTGTPNFYYHALDTETEDYDFTSLLPVAPLAGDKLTITNTGTILGGNKIINAPNGESIYPQQTVDYTYNFAESVWRRSGSEFGYEQAWSDETLNRVSGTTYTNNTGRSITVLLNTAGTGCTVVIDAMPTLYVDQGAGLSTGTYVIPNGSSYTATSFVAGKWLELR